MANIKGIVVSALGSIIITLMLYIIFALDFILFIFICILTSIYFSALTINILINIYKQLGGK